MTQFEVGKTYMTRSIGDHNCIIRVTIANRTAKTVTTADGKKFRVSVRRDPYETSSVESIRPWGSYSMCPILDATDTAVLRADWEKEVAA